MLSDHLCGMNEKLTSQKDEIDVLKTSGNSNSGQKSSKFQLPGRKKWMHQIYFLIIYVIVYTWKYFWKCFWVEHYFFWVELFFLSGELFFLSGELFLLLIHIRVWKWFVIMVGWRLFNGHKPHYFDLFNFKLKLSNIRLIPGKRTWNAIIFDSIFLS